MARWQRLLQDGDPLRTEPMLDPVRAGQMRERIVRHAAPQDARERLEAGRSSSWPKWTPGLSVCGVGLCAAAVLVATWPPPAAVPSSGTRPADQLTQARTSELRQVHFATAGGTRIIWVFNPEFNEER